MVGDLTLVFAIVHVSRRRLLTLILLSAEAGQDNAYDDDFGGGDFGGGDF